MRITLFSKEFQLDCVGILLRTKTIRNIFYFALITRVSAERFKDQPAAPLEASMPADVDSPRAGHSAELRARQRWQQLIHSGMQREESIR